MSDIEEEAVVDEAVGRKRPAWEDEDDETLAINITKANRLRKLRKTEEEEVVTGVEYQERLRAQFRLLQRNSGTWADLNNTDGDEERGSDDEGDAAQALSRTTKRTVANSAALPSGVLDVTRMKDANIAAPSEAVVQSVEFHPNSELFLTGGFDKKVRLFQVDGLKNPHVQTIYLDDLPVHKAQFSPAGDEIIICGRRKYYYSYDMIAGRVGKIMGIQGREEKSWESFFISPNGEDIAFMGNHGYTVLVDMKTKMWKADLKMNGPVRAAAFAPSGNYLYTAGVCQDVYTWDLRMRRCLNRCIDEGSISTTSMDVSPNGQYLAVGSDNGVVNVYNTDTVVTERNPKPLKALMNLTTSASGVKFNSESNMLMMRSGEKKESMRLAHLPSLTVFKNWPTAKTPLQYVSAAAFSPNSGYFAVGNQKGRALLYRLNHFSRA